MEMNHKCWGRVTNNFDRKDTELLCSLLLYNTKKTAYLYLFDSRFLKISRYMNVI